MRSLQTRLDRLERSMGVGGQEHPPPGYKLAAGLTATAVLYALDREIAPGDVKVAEKSGRPDYIFEGDRWVKQPGGNLLAGNLIDDLGEYFAETDLEDRHA